MMTVMMVVRKCVWLIYHGTVYIFVASLSAYGVAVTMAVLVATGAACDNVTAGTTVHAGGGYRIFDACPCM